ncbi:suppressor of fused domain protein [Sporomusa aerivorans]|uniref:suppressor of fused domain protein n=1 Tax=Sporomusa aerivorans TaxID=204936 RepID=UPI00352B4620
MSNILIEEFSPACNIQAFVEEYDDCTYFYLWNFPGEEHSSVSSCWIRNYSAAPEKLDVQAMKDGNAPMLTVEYCAHPDGAEKLQPEDLSIIWFEECDAAALLYKNEILSIIPSWSGMGEDYKYPGYARDCIKESNLCFPLGTPDTNVLFKRVETSMRFWQSWDNNPWPSIQQNFVDAITSSLGSIEKYYAIDGGKWPPKAMVKVVRENITYIVTLGVSLLPQPKVEQYADQPELLRRFEFAFAIESEWLSKNERQMLRYISSQTSLPWSNLIFLADGHTIPCKEVSTIKNNFEFVLLSKPEAAPRINLPSINGDTINLLWIIPITPKERNYAEKNGSDKLIAKSKDKSHWIFNGKSKFLKESWF